MKLFSRKYLAVGVLLVSVCAMLAASALAATTTRPKLVNTSVQQVAKQMAVAVSFKISKHDSTLSWRGKICVEGKCKSTATMSGLPVSEAQVTQYTPNFIFKLDEIHKNVTVKSTITLGKRSYSYTSHSKDIKSPCIERDGASRSDLLPRC
jgi:hypothetical protein